MLLVELKFCWTLFIELVAELTNFFGQNWLATIKYPWYDIKRTIMSVQEKESTITKYTRILDRD